MTTPSQGKASPGTAHEAWTREQRQPLFLASHLPLLIPLGRERLASLTPQFATVRLIRILASGVFILIREAIKELGFALRSLPLITFRVKWFQKPEHNDVEG